MKKTKRLWHFDDAGGGGLRPRMVRELCRENETLRAALAGVPTEDEKELSRKLEAMIENARRESNLQLPDR